MRRERSFLRIVCSTEMKAESLSSELPWSASTVLSESVMRVPDMMSGKLVDFRVLIWSRRFLSAVISAALFSVTSGSGKEEEMSASPMSMMVEHPDAFELFVEPSVKAMKWEWEGRSGMNGGGGVGE